MDSTAISDGSDQAAMGPNGRHYDEVRSKADAYTGSVVEQLPPDLRAGAADLLRDVENFLVGAYVDIEFKGYWNTEVGDGVSTFMAISNVREAMRQIGVEPDGSGLRVTPPEPEEKGRDDPDESVGPCVRCGHDPACGFASVNGDWLCHDDDHSCYFEDSADHACSGRRIAAGESRASGSHEDGGK